MILRRIRIFAFEGFVSLRLPVTVDILDVYGEPSPPTRCAFRLRYEGEIGYKYNNPH